MMYVNVARTTELIAEDKKKLLWEGKEILLSNTQNAYRELINEN